MRGGRAWATLLGMELVWVAAALTALPLALVVLTALGSRRRGAGRVRAAAAGALFPVTWVAWYLVDAPPRWWHAAGG